MHRILNNWSLKLISLVLAVMLWSHVRSEVNPLETATVEVPLRMRSPRGFDVAQSQNLPTKISVVLRGPRQSLRELKGGSLPNPLAAPDTPPLVTSNTIKAVLNWTSPRIGEQEVSIRAETRLPDIEVLGAKPDRVTVVLQKAAPDFSVQTSADAGEKP